MTETTQNPDVTCAQKERIGDDCNDEGTYYKVPFIFGREGRVAAEWWCESCIEGDELFELEDGTVYLTRIGGEQVAKAEDVIETAGDCLPDDW